MDLMCIYTKMHTNTDTHTCMQILLHHFIGITLVLAIPICARYQDYIVLNTSHANHYLYTLASNHAVDFKCKLRFLTLGQITAAESLFTYEPGENVNSFAFPDHVPPLLDEILDSLEKNATLLEVCGDNAECLFDFSQTNDPDVGMAAMMVENETATEMQAACKNSSVYISL